MTEPHKGIMAEEDRGPLFGGRLEAFGDRCLQLVFGDPVRTWRVWTFLGLLVVVFMFDNWPIEQRSIGETLLRALVVAAMPFVIRFVEYLIRTAGED